MSILCWLGIHRWVFRDIRHHGVVDTNAKCGRRCCSRYPTWMTVNRDRIGT